MNFLLAAGQIALRYAFLDQQGLPSAELARVAARRGRIPKPIRLPGSRQIRWRLQDLMAWEQELGLIQPTPARRAPPRLGGKRGRPTKAEQVERRRAFEKLQAQQAQVIQK